MIHSFIPFISKRQSFGFFSEEAMCSGQLAFPSFRGNINDDVALRAPACQIETPRATHPRRDPSFTPMKKALFVVRLFVCHQVMIESLILAHIKLHPMF